MLDQEQDHLLKAEPEVTETVDLHQKDGKELKKKLDMGKRTNETYSP